MQNWEMRSQNFPSTWRWKFVWYMRKINGVTQEMSSSWYSLLYTVRNFSTMVSTQVLRLMVDAAVNRTLLSKSYNEAYAILERIANNNYQWAGVHNVDVLKVLSA